jgi:hypothetical protein
MAHGRGARDGSRCGAICCPTARASARSPARGLDERWANEVDLACGVHVTAQGLLMYLARGEVDALLELCARRLPRQMLIFDAVPTWCSFVATGGIGRKAAIGARVDVGRGSRRVGTPCAPPGRRPAHRAACPEGRRAALRRRAAGAGPAPRAAPPTPPLPVLVARLAAAPSPSWATASASAARDHVR